MTNPRALILALDYGGTKHTAAILAACEHEWLAHQRVYSPAGADGDYDRATMTKMARELLACTEGKLAAIGVSFGGPVDATTGTVRLSHHVPGWEDTPLRHQLQAEFGVPTSVDNDANVAALGEWRFGAGQGSAMPGSTSFNTQLPSSTTTAGQTPRISSSWTMQRAPSTPPISSS